MLEGYLKTPPKMVRFPHLMPEKGMKVILVTEDHKQGTLSKDRSVVHDHVSKTKEMAVAWAY